MSFDLYFVTLKARAYADADDAVRAPCGDDDDRDFHEVLAPYLRPGLAPGAARATVLAAARTVLKRSPFVKFESTPLAALPLEERVAEACSRLFECEGEHPAVVPLSLSWNADLKELVRFAAVLLNALPRDVFLYDPQTNQLLDRDQVLDWSDV